MDAKVKKILKATKQENMNPSIDFASGQRSRVNTNVGTSANGAQPSKGTSGAFGSFLNKNK